MENELQILIVEDDPADAIRMTHELRKQGLKFRSVRIETRDDFMRALKEQPPDLVLSDHGLPSFTGFSALEIIRERCPKVPFIFVTGHYDQGLMVEMFESGASGYVYKNHLQDLVPAIQQAFAEVGQPAPPPETLVIEKTATPTPPGRIESTPARGSHLICSRCKKVRTETGDWEQIDIYLRKHRQATVTLGLCPECATRRQEPSDR